MPTNRRIQGREERGEGRGRQKTRESRRQADKRRSGRTRRRSRQSFPVSPLLVSSSPPLPDGWLEIVGARHNNLKNINVQIPLGTFTVVTGPSGSGKSSLVEDVLFASLARTLHRAKTFPGAHDAIRGVELVNKVIRVDQQPLGQTPTSNPATFTGVFDLIRTLYAQLPEAKLRGYTPRRFSFNVPGGRCEKCEGNGQLRIEMHFLPDVWVECDTCRGQRYNPETLAVRYHGRSIADVLDMSCGEAVKLFANIPKIRRPLQTLCDVGLDYLTLGQPAPTLSGGEAQRVKLAAELSRPDTGRTLYLLDEPTTGLHFDDLAKLLDVLNRLVDLGNTVVVIEHNLDVIKTADWVIDLGPEAGDEGGYVVAAGTPEDIVAGERGEGRRGDGRQGDKETRSTTPVSCLPVSPLSPLPSRSHTAEALAPVLAAGPLVERKPYDFAAEAAAREDDRDITDVGRDAQMPWETDGRRWHTVDRVGRTGNPCRWDGRILAEVVDRIQEKSDLFGETDWSERTRGRDSRGEEIGRLVLPRHHRRGVAAEDEVPHGAEHVQAGGIGREARSEAAERHARPAALRHRAAGAVPEPPRPVAGNRTARAWLQRDRPPGVLGVRRSRGGGLRHVCREGAGEVRHPASLEATRPHVAPRPPRVSRSARRSTGSVNVLEDLLELLAEIAPQAQFLWNNKQVVPIYLPGRHDPWAAVQTKKLDAVYLHLMAPKGRFAMGQITELGYDPELDGQPPERRRDPAEVPHAGRSRPRRLAGVLAEALGGKRRVVEE